MHEITERFVAALNALHSARDVNGLVDLFAEDATLSKSGVPAQEHGKQGARNFWQRYREVFDTIDASFRHTISAEGIAFLEWTSHGTLSDGSDFRYDGVSVLEAYGDSIDAFRTYYDTAAFLAGGGKTGALRTAG